MVLKGGDNDPYFRDDPGIGFKRIPVYKFDIEKNFSVWKLWRTHDGRVLPNPNSHFDLVNNPFETGSLFMLTTYFDPALSGKAFGGFGMRAPIVPALQIDNQTYVEFDLYYPISALGKYMRFEIWSTSSNGEGIQTAAGQPGTVKTQAYIRPADLSGFGFKFPDRVGFHNGDTWHKTAIYVVTPITSGTWEYLNIDIHTENGVSLNGEQLMLGNIRITQRDPNGIKIPDIAYSESYLEVEPLKNKYNLNNGSFLIGVTGTGRIEPDSIRARHYEIFVGDDNLKPERHINPPQWLKDEFPKFKFKTDSLVSEGSVSEWKLPTKEYSDIRDSGNPDEYKMHGHCLAWNNQSPPWMEQIIPENIYSTEWNKDGLFFSYGVNAAEPFQKIKKETARRVYFNHILCVMRHFMSVDARYGSSEDRGVIPFHSFDVVNIEIHENKHTEIIQKDKNEWKTALRNLSWLIAMTDNDYNDIKQHYIYLLFKFAHIAVPNAQMAAKYKEGFHDPNVVPEYMKLDFHDDNGSIDAYISEKPPVLVYNEYEIASCSKIRVAYNMIKEINSAWKSDALYDGRN